MYKFQLCTSSGFSISGELINFQAKSWCFVCLLFASYLIVLMYKIVIAFYLPSCLDQETTMGSFGLRVKLPPSHRSTTHGGGCTLFLLLLNVKQGSCEHRRSQGGPRGPGPPPIKIPLTTKSYDNIAWRCLAAVFCQ